MALSTELKFSETEQLGMSKMGKVLGAGFFQPKPGAAPDTSDKVSQTSQKKFEKLPNPFLLTYHTSMDVTPEIRIICT